MAAFSRGSLLVVRHTALTPFKLPVLLSPPSISQTPTARCAFSHSAIRMKKPMKGNRRILNVNAKLEEMKQRQQQLQGIKKGEQVLATKPLRFQPQPPSQPPAQAPELEPLASTVETQGSIPQPAVVEDQPLAQHIQQPRPRQSEVALQKNSIFDDVKQIESKATEILEDGQPVVLYIGPTKRWHLSVAAALVFSAGSFLAFGTLTFYWPELAEGTYNIAAILASVGAIALGSYCIWNSIRRTALRVNSIRLLPRLIGETRIFEVEIKGSGWLPFTKQSITVPIWEVSVDRPMTKAVLPQRGPEKNLREYFNGLRPFIWLGQTVKRIFEEGRYVVLANPFSLRDTVMLSLKIEDDKFNKWLVDGRASMLLGGPKGFDYFIRSIDRSIDDGEEDED